jgi:hypothetical protein
MFAVFTTLLVSILGLKMNLETRQTGRLRNRWQDEVRENGRIGLWRRVARKSI